MDRYSIFDMSRPAAGLVYDPKTNRFVDPNQVAAMQQPGPQRGKGGTKTSFISEGGALAGGIAGATIGSAVPVIGTAIGGIIGAGLGAFGGRLAENKVRDNRWGVGDAAQEGALSAVLAGPLKLGKYAKDATKVGMAASKGGATLAEALAQGGRAGAQAADTATLRGVLASKTSDVADNLAQRGLKMNNSNFNTQFFNRTGEEVGQFARRFKIPQIGIEQAVDTVYAPASQAYGQALQQVGAIPKGSIITELKDATAKFASSKIPAQQQLAQDIDQYVQGILKNYKGNTIPAFELNKTKQELYSQLNKGITDKAGKYENNVIDNTANIFRRAINNAADARGITADPAITQLGFKSTKVGDLGQELFALHDHLDQAARKSRVGSGASLITLGSLPGITIMSGGGPVGAALAGAGTMAINSTTGRKVTAKAADKAANMLAGGTQTLGRTMATGARRGLQGGLLSAPSRVGQSENMAAATQSMNSATMPDMNNMVPPQYDQTDPNAIQSAPSDSPFDPANVDANVASIMQQGGTLKDVKEYISLVQALQSVKGTTGSGSKGLNSTAAGVVADTTTGLQTLSDLYTAIQNSNANNPGIGQLRAKIPFDTAAQNLQAQVATAKQIVGKALEGGVLRKEDEVKYAKLLPTMGDTDAVAKFKIEQLYSLISQRLNEYQSAMAGGSGGVDPAALGL